MKGCFNGDGGLRIPTDVGRIKQKIRGFEAKNKQYNSLCYDVEEQKMDPGHTKEERIIKKQRRNTKNVSSSSSKKLIRSQSRGIQKSARKNQVKHDIGSLYGQLMEVKSQYKKLKGSYQKLSQENMELTARGFSGRVGEKQKEKMEEMQRELEKYKKNNQTLEGQLERIRKECVRIIQTQKFKNKKLEEIIQQKDLMICFLRSELEKAKRSHESTLSTANQSAVMYYHNISQVNFGNGSTSTSNIVLDLPGRSRIEEDSLCFSRDHSKEMESISSVLTYNDVKRQCVVIQPKRQQLFTQPSQCLTFEQRQEQFKQACKMPPKQTNSKKAMSKSKTSSKHSKKPVLTIGDQNADTNSKCDSVEQKLLSSYGSKHRKKTMSSRKKI